MPTGACPRQAAEALGKGRLCNRAAHPPSPHESTGIGIRSGTVCLSPCLPAAEVTHLATSALATKIPEGRTNTTRVVLPSAPLAEPSLHSKESYMPIFGQQKSQALKTQSSPYQGTPVFCLDTHILRANYILLAEFSIAHPSKLRKQKFSRFAYFDYFAQFRKTTFVGFDHTITLTLLSTPEPLLPPSKISTAQHGSAGYQKYS